MRAGFCKNLYPALALLVLLASGQLAAAGQKEVGESLRGDAAKHPQWVGGLGQRLLAQRSAEGRRLASQKSASTNNDEEDDPNEWDPDDDGDDYDEDDHLREWAGEKDGGRVPPATYGIILALGALLILFFACYCGYVHWMGRHGMKEFFDEDEVMAMKDNADDANTLWHRQNCGKDASGQRTPPNGASPTASGVGFGMQPPVNPVVYGASAGSASGAAARYATSAGAAAGAATRC